MAHILEGPHLALKIDQDSGCFDILDETSHKFLLQGCKIWVNYCYESWNKSRMRFRLHESECQSFEHEVGHRGLSFMNSDQQQGLEWRVDFWMERQLAMLFWRVAIRNISQHPVFIQQIGLMRAADAQAGNLKLNKLQSTRDLTFFSNGWQSWSIRGAYGSEQRMRQTRLGILQEPMIYNPGTPKGMKTGDFSSDFFAVLGDTKNRNGLLFGFLSQKQQFGTQFASLSETPSMSMWANGDDARLDPGVEMHTDTAVLMPIEVDAPDPLEAYLQAVAHEHHIHQLPSSPSGWCSWYEYYQGISESIIRENLEILDNLKTDLPLGLLQIDDGFQAQVGDWLQFGPAFSNGVKDLAFEIQGRGFTPGLWLAPFILHPASRTARDHPEWLLHTVSGRLARAGFGWNTLSVALDLTVPEALDYACQAVQTAVHTWGFPYIKLDFLYAAAVKGLYRDNTRTRAQVLRSGMRALREAAGEETFLLGCGAPLGSVIGLVDAMRISADVSDSWKPSFLGISFPFRDEPSMPCARNAIQNIVTSAYMHERWWINDPDCLLVRPDSHLSLAEVQSLATAIAMTGGSLLLSDALAKLSPDRLRLAASMLPPINQRARVLDWLDEVTPSRLRLDLHKSCGQWTLAAFFNWADKMRRVTLHPSDFDLSAEKSYLVRSFWDNQIDCVPIGRPLIETDLPAHAVLLLALREYQPGKPVYAGSNLHISQGLEVEGWQPYAQGISFDVSLNRRFEGFMDVCLPEPLDWAEMEGQKMPHQFLQKGLYRISVEGRDRAHIALRYKT